MSTLTKILCNAETPKAFRLYVADVLSRSRVCSGQNWAAIAHGWNAAQRALGGTDLVDTSGLPRFFRPLAEEMITITPSGCKGRNVAQILHPKWRDAIERGEHLPDEEGELFTPSGAVTEFFTPFETGSPVLDAVIGDHPNVGHPPENEVPVIQVESSTHDASHSTPAAAPASNPFPDSTQPCCPAEKEVAK